MSRLAGKAAFELGEKNGFGVSIHSAYDNQTDLDERYFPASAFKGFGRRKAAFVLQSIHQGTQSAIVILSHINLLSVGYAIKQLHPKTNLVLLAHGIEVWQSMPMWKRRMLKACDLILPVSEFTRNKMIKVHGVAKGRLTVINNCLDPFLPPCLKKEKSRKLLQRYGFTTEHKILFTLTRLSFKERYKGYDEVMMAVKSLKKEEPNLRYLIAGNYDTREKVRLDRIVEQQGLQNEIVFAGFIPDEELAEHFSLADAYIMPSRKEGFGIVFIEALYYGLPVIAGNVDGSVDAVANGEMGFLVNPDNPVQIKSAVKQILQNKKRAVPSREEVLSRFGFEPYKEKLGNALGISLNNSVLQTKPLANRLEIEEAKQTAPITEL